MTVERWELDRAIMAVIRDWPGEWFSASLMYRMVRTVLGFGLYDPDAPSLTWVARRMAALAKAGELEREVRDGAWSYRAL